MSHRGWVATTMRDRGAVSAPIPRAQTWLLASGWGAAWPSPGGSLPFIWWPCWPTTGAYAAARVASSASTRCRWKAACHILLPRRHGPADWSGSDAARDGPPSPGDLRLSRSGEPSGIDLPPKRRSGPVLLLSETVGKSSLRATLERRLLRAVLSGHPPSLGHRVMARLPSTQQWRRTKLRPSGIEGWWRCPS